MKNNTPQRLSKRLVKYSALSLAIAGLADVNGQVMYNDIADLSGTSSSWLDLDVDGNGIIDYQILQNNYVLLVRPAGSGYYNSNSILGLGPGIFKYPFALSSGNPISSAASVWVNDADYQTMNWNSCNYPNSQWCGVTNGYLGLKFDISGSTHYGWARIDGSLNPQLWTLYDFGWEATAGVGIAAGDTGVLGVEDNTFDNVKIIALNKSIALYNLTGNTNYNLFSISGQSILKGTTDNDTYVIEVNTVATGVYILELEDANSNAVIRKKVIL